MFNPQKRCVIGVSLNEHFRTASHLGHAADGAMRRIGYARVSTEEQSLALQMDALRRAGCDQIFRDKLSGKTRDRPGLKRALARLGKGDTFVVWKLDRMGRSFNDLVDIGKLIEVRQANFLSLTEGMDTSTQTGLAMFRMMSIFSDLERDFISQRTCAGIQARKARGQRFGRRPKLSPEQIVEVNRLLAAGQSIKSLTHRFSVGRSTIFRARQCGAKFLTL